MRNTRILVLTVTVMLCCSVTALSQPTIYGIRFNSGAGSRIDRLDVSTGESMTVLERGDGVMTSLALDATGSKLYVGGSRGYIFRSNLDGSNVETLLSSETFRGGYRGGFGTPCDQRAIALDLPAGKIYATGGGWCVGHFFRANLDGAELERLDGSVEGWGMVLDPDLKQAYVYGGFIPRTIMRIDLNGMNRDTLITGSDWIDDMAVDTGAGKIYWVSRSSAAILRADLDGSNVERVADVEVDWTSIALDLVQREIYFSGVASSDSLYRAKLDGSNRVAISEGGFHRIVVDASVATAVEPEASAPQGYHLSQNYPNPFNPSTSISYSLPGPSDVMLTVFDVLGRTVKVLAAGRKPAGTHEVRFDATGLPSGLYVYRLETGGFAETKSLVFMK